MVQNLIGQLLMDRFRVEALLGEGAFARVYRVHDIRRGVDLAAKVLREDIAHDPAFVERFRREAGVLEQLKHPHIVRYYETVETPEGVVFILMDYIEGTTLQTYLYHRKSPIPPHDTLKYARAICSALGYAHREGIIHRDVKPGNILLSDNGQIYVTDFGIARLLNEASTLTQGLTIGTPTYMAPEQLMGRPVTPAADIYAFGVVLYQMMTERVPFRGDKPEAEGTTISDRVAYEHIHLMPQPPSQINPAITPAVEGVILRCLQKDPAKRFPTAPAIYEALAQAVGETPAPAQELIAGTPNPPSITLPEWSMLMRQVEGQQGKPATSAQPATAAQPPATGVQPPMTGAQPPRPGTVAPPPQAPGQTVQSRQQPTIQGQGMGPTVVSSNRQPGVRDTQPHPTIPSAYTPPPGAEYQSQQGYPPNYGSTGRGDPYQSDEASDRRRQMMIIGGVGAAGLLVLVFCIGAILLLSGGNNDEDSLPTSRPISAAQQTATAIVLTGGTQVPTSAARPGEPAGEVLVYSQFVEGDYDIFSLDLDRGQSTRLTSGPMFEYGAVASPNGSQVAYHAASSLTGAADIYIVSAAGGTPQQITNTPADERFPTWSPDGTRLIFQSNSEGDFDLVIYNTTTRQSQNLTTSPADEEDAAWSPDGSRITFASDADGAYEIYMINADGTGQRQLTNRPWASARHPSWAPDASRIMFQANENNVDLIYAVNPDGGGLQRLFGFNDQTFGAWSHNARKIAFVSGSGNTADIFVADFSRGVAYKVIDDALYPDWLR